MITSLNGLGDMAVKFLRKGSQAQIETSWLRPSAWIDLNGEAHVSLDLDANRITLLARADQQPEQEEIPF